jgi:hypothetical protein
MFFSQFWFWFQILQKISSTILILMRIQTLEKVNSGPSQKNLNLMSFNLANEISSQHELLHHKYIVQPPHCTTCIIYWWEETSVRRLPSLDG